MWTRQGYNASIDPTWTRKSTQSMMSCNDLDRFDYPVGIHHSEFIQSRVLPATTSSIEPSSRRQHRPLTTIQISTCKISTLVRYEPKPSLLRFDSELPEFLTPSVARDFNYA